MMKKEFEFAIKADNEDFNRKIEASKKQLQDLAGHQSIIHRQMQMDQKLHGMGLGGGQTPASQAAFRQQTQAARREVEQHLQKEVQAQRDLAKVIVQRNEGMEKLLKKQKEVVGDVEKEKQVREEIARHQANTAQEMVRYREKEQQIDRLAETRQNLRGSGVGRMYDAWKGGGARGAMNEGRSILSEMPIQEKMGIAAAIAGALGGMIKAGTTGYRYFNGGATLEAQSAMGSATSGTLGREIAAAYSGNSALESTFLPEKAAAARLALKHTSAIQSTQPWNLAGDMLLRGGAGVLAGAAGGALTGLIGGPGGAAAGALYGGITGGIAGIGSAFTSSPDNRDLVYGLLSKDADANRKARLAQQFAADYQSNLQAQKDQNPFETMTKENYHANHLRNLDFQRRVGLNFDSFHGAGGFRERAINAGFLDNMAMNEASGILGAGGSTRMAQNSILGLQAARAYGVTNSSSILGKLSGSIGDSEASKKAFIEMIAEGQRKGLDSSKFAEENRRFLDATASIIASSGTTDKNEISRLTQKFGGYVAENTTQGISAAQNAYQTYVDRTSQTSGPLAVLRFAAMKKDSRLNKLNGLQLAGAFAIPEDQRNADNPAVRSYARAQGVTPEEMAETLRDDGSQGQTRLPQLDQNMAQKKKNKEEYEKLGWDPTLKPDEIKKRREALLKANQLIDEDDAGMNYAEGTNYGKDQKTVAAIAAGQGGGKPTDIITTPQVIDQTLNNKNTGRLEDQTVQANAEGTRLLLDNLGKMKDQVAGSAEAVAQLNSALKELVDIAKQMPANERAGMWKMFGNMMGNQTQGGSR